MHKNGPCRFRCGLCCWKRHFPGGESCAGAGQGGRTPGPCAPRPCARHKRGAYAPGLARHRPHGPRRRVPCGRKEARPGLLGDFDRNLPFRLMPGLPSARTFFGAFARPARCGRAPGKGLCRGVGEGGKTGAGAACRGLFLHAEKARPGKCGRITEMLYCNCLISQKIPIFP